MVWIQLSHALLCEEELEYLFEELFWFWGRQHHFLERAKVQNFCKANKSILSNRNHQIDKLELFDQLNVRSWDTFENLLLHFLSQELKSYLTEKLHIGFVEFTALPPLLLQMINVCLVIKGKRVWVKFPKCIQIGKRLTFSLDQAQKRMCVSERDVCEFRIHNVLEYLQTKTKSGLASYWFLLKFHFNLDLRNKLGIDALLESFLYLSFQREEFLMQNLQELSFSWNQQTCVQHNLEELLPLKYLGRLVSWVRNIQDDAIKDWLCHSLCWLQGLDWDLSLLLDNL